MLEAGSNSMSGAADMLDAALDQLAAVDWASLGTQAHGEMLARLSRVQTRLTAVQAAVLSVFTAQCGYEPDGHRSPRAWLIGKTGISAGAASGAVGWRRRLDRDICRPLDDLDRSLGNLRAARAAMATRRNARLAGLPASGSGTCGAGSCHGD